MCFVTILSCCLQVILRIQVLVMLHSPRMSILSGALYRPRVRQWQLLHHCTEVLLTGLPWALLPGKWAPFVEPATGPFQLVVASTDTWRCIGHFVSSMPATSAPRNSHGLAISPHICASPTGHLIHVVLDASATPKQSYLPAETLICFLCLHFMALFTSHLYVLTRFTRFTWQSFSWERDIMGLTPNNPSFILL